MRPGMAVCRSHAGCVEKGRDERAQAETRGALHGHGHQWGIVGCMKKGSGHIDGWGMS